MRINQCEFFFKKMAEKTGEEEKGKLVNDKQNYGVILEEVI